MKVFLRFNHYLNFYSTSAKAELGRINNIYALEGALYSEYLGIAGTVDCIAEHDGELSIIDFKTSRETKPRDWIDGYFGSAALMLACYMR